VEKELGLICGLPSVGWKSSASMADSGPCGGG
jgi:hypothetical protein